MAWTTQNGVNFDFGVKFDLEGHGQSPPPPPPPPPKKKKKKKKTIRILTKVFYTYGRNLVILTWTVVSYRADKHVIDAHPDGHTDRQTQATTIPESQNWPRVKNTFLSC